MKLYDNDGWVNWDYIMNQKESIISVVGARGVGKTYGLMKWLIEHKEKFIYLRRLKSQLDQSGKTEGNPFKKLCADMDISIAPYSSGGILTYRYNDKTGDIVAVGVALSVVANIRGIDFSDYKYIVFDEFIANIGERPIKDEFNAFLNFYETVNRNRELNGEAAVKAILLGNANTLINPYFAGWHFMRTAIKMINGGQMVWRSDDNTRMMILLLNSPISKKKESTALYLNAGKDFVSMALDNSFRTDETRIKSEPLKEYNHIVSIGEIGIYKHKSQRKYYVSTTVSRETFYEPFGIHLKMFMHDYYMFRVYYLINKSFTFESYECEIIFRQIFDI